MIGFIGGGKMAEALIRGMVSAGKRDIVVSDKNSERRTYIEKSLGVKTTGSNPEVLSQSKILVLAVKPQDIPEVLDEIAHLVTEDKTVVSIAAGITLSYLRQRLKTKKIVRVMPNVGSLVQEGMAVMSLCECFPDSDINIVREIFMASGKVAVMPEKHINIVTALSGSGPAFIARFVELMVQGAVSLGLREDEALMLAVQTLVGTSRLLDGEVEPARLIEMVRSPGGTTAAGLQIFDERGFAGIVFEAIKAAVKRAEELSVGNESS